MAMNYTPIPHDFLEEMGELSDAEYGRLVRWGQEYMIRGTTTGLSGNERFYAKRMQMQLDRYKANYEEALEQKRAAGRASAEQRRLTALNGVQQKPTEANEINETKTKTETKKKTETTGDNPPLSPQGETDLSAFGPELQDRIREWLRYKREKGQAYKPTGLKQFLGKIKASADQYGEKAVCEAIVTSEMNNWQGIFFDKLEGRNNRGLSEPAAAGNRGGDRDAAWGIRATVGPDRV